jgi:hypothetical protein
MEVQTEFLWDEKNYTEQKTNCENKKEQGTSDTTNDIKISSTQIDWRDITDPKLRRKMRQKIYYEKNKYKTKEQRKLYREANKHKRKAWIESNKEKLKIKNKIWRETNAEKRKAWYEANKEKMKIWRQENKEERKIWRETNKEKIKQYKKIYNQINQDRVKEYSQLYRKKNKKNIYEKEKLRLQNNVQFKLKKGLRTRLRTAVKRNYKSGSAVKDLGCTIDELKTYLESKFQEGMSWDNWTKDGWHIDHIRPLSSFDLTNREELLQAVHYTNLQPLWAKDNLAKKDKMV